MKLALVDIDPITKDPKLGLGYIASYLRKYGSFNDVIIIDKEDPIKAVEKENPDLIGVSCLSLEYKLVKQFAEKIKPLDIPLIIGGPHITCVPHKIDKLFDIGVIGEGEQTMLELMQLFEKEGSFDKSKLDKIDGIVYRDGNNIKQTNRRKLINPLDSIPYPARDLMNMDYYLQIRQFMPDKLGVYSQIMTSRGCPYNCVFCSSKVFWQTTRFHSAEYVVNEIKLLIEKYKSDGIIIYDDLFIADRKRLEKIVEMIKSEGIDVEFWLQARANLINERICKLLKEMNVFNVSFGLESGSEKILRYLKKGTVTVEDNRRAIRLCKQSGISVMGFFIIGSPGETEEDLRQTLDLVKDKNIDTFHVWQLTPFPNTEVWSFAEKQGIVSDETDLSKFSLNYNPDMVLNDEIPKEKFKEWYDLFQEEMHKKWYEKSPKLEIKHLRQILSLRFAIKLARKWRYILNYLRYRMVKK